MSDVLCCDIMTPLGDRNLSPPLQSYGTTVVHMAIGDLNVIIGHMTVLLPPTLASRSFIAPGNS